MAMLVKLIGGVWDGHEITIGENKSICYPRVYAGGDMASNCTDIYTLDEGKGTMTFEKTIVFGTEDWHAPIGENLFNDIVENAPEKKNEMCLLELGSGTTTGLLAKHMWIVSIENDPQWYSVSSPFFAQIHAPLDETGWYNKTILKNALQYIKYNAILVDGPATTFKDRMDGFIKNINLFNPNATCYFDDTFHPIVRAGVEEISEILNRPIEWHDKDAKTWAVIREAV